MQEKLSSNLKGKIRRSLMRVRKDDSATVNTMLKADKKFLGIRDAKGLTPLMVAATYNKLKCAEALIKAGADLKATNESGRTALHAASSAGYLDMVKLLVANGSDVNARSKSPWVHRCTRRRLVGAWKFAVFCYPKGPVLMRLPNVG